MEKIEVLHNRISQYEYKKIRELKKGLLHGFIPIILFIGFGIWLIMHKGYFLGGLLIFIMLLFLYVYPKSIYEYSIRKKLHTIFHQEIRNYDHIELILKKIEKISKTLKPIISQKKAFDKEELRTEYLNNLLQYYILILTDLRSDLTLRLTEQQSTLEQAKSEVSTHIHGTTELNQASELQRQRLDRQIEQFEELQRVLVKI